MITSYRNGFTFIEMVVVVAIIGMLVLAFYPSINNSLETRNLENQAREILSTMQRAKFQAVKTKLNHRVRFFQEEGYWVYTIEREESTGGWSVIPGFIKKSIPSKFTVTVSLPQASGAEGKSVLFSSLGFITNFDLNQNKVTLKSEKLWGYTQPDLREILVYAGGSIDYEKSSTG